MKLFRLAGFSGLLLFIAVAFYYPLAGIVSRGLDANLGSVLVDFKLWQVVWFTVWQALFSTSLTVALGLVGAYLLYRKSFRFQQTLRALVTVPFVLPVLVIAIAFSSFQFWNSSENPLLLIIAAHVFINFSLVARTVGSAWLSLDSQIEEAAEIDGAGRFKTFAKITLPSLAPSVISAATLTMAYCLASFSVILILGNGLLQSIETSIYRSALVYLDLGKASVLAIIQLALTAIMFALAEFVAKSTRIDFTDAGAASNKKLDRRDLPVTLAGILISAFFVLPIWNVFQKAVDVSGMFSLHHFANLFSSAQMTALDLSIADAALNSVRNTALALAISMTVGTLVAYLLTHSKRGALNRLLDFAYLAPLGVSTVMLGLGYLVSFSTPPLALRSSWFAVVLAQSLLALPLVVRMLYSALGNVNRELIEAARLDGAGDGQIFWQLELPLIRKTFETAAGFAAIIALGDFGASSFLAYGDQQTLPLVLYRLFSHPGAQNYGMAMAMSALLIVLTVSVTLLISWRGSFRRNALAG